MHDFTLVNESITSSRELELDFHDQQYLAQGIRKTVSELEDIPDLIPDQTDTILDQIPSRNIHGILGPGNEMGIFLSETKEGRRSAAISLAERAFTPVKFQLAPSSDMWEEWRPREKRPRHILDNSSFISLLSTRLKNPEILEKLLDSPTIEALELIRILASQLKSAAKKQERLIRYGTTLPLASKTGDYVSNSEVTLSLKETRWKRTHRLAVGALYEVGKATVLKQYSYATTTTARSMRGAGYVSASSSDGIPANRLSYFTDIDQEDNYPLDTLHDSLSAVRQAYDLYDERRAA